MSKQSIWTLLSKKYPGTEYCLMQEVHDSTGASHSRSADYVAVSLWPSRGLAVNGIELKSHRSDWLSELRNPKKAESIFRYCDYFWLLTSDDSVAKLEEIPDTWGWMSIKGEKIFIKKAAPKLTPIELKKSFVVAMLRRAADRSSYIHIDSVSDRLVAEKEIGRSESALSIERLTIKVQALNKSICDFEITSGLKIDTWNAGKLGETVKFVQSGGVVSLVQQLKSLQDAADKISDKIKRTISEISIT